MQLNERVARIEEALVQMMDNHLPHLKEDIKEIGGKLDRLQWFFLVTAIGLLGDIIVRLVVK